MPRPSAALQGAIARRGRGARLYPLAARAIGGALVAGVPGAGVWVRGGVAAGELVPGVSDLDLVAVAPDRDAAAGVRARRRFVRGPVGVAVYSREELTAAVREPLAFHEGLDDELWLRTRPGLYGPTDGWTRVAGTGALPSPPERDDAAQRLAAWLELQWWWRHAIAACLEPDRAHVPWLLVKLAVEPVRVHAWLADRERVSRRAAIDRLEPAEAAAARAVLSDPVRPTDPALLLGACVRGTRAVAALMREPLPHRPGAAAITVRRGSLADPSAIAAAARDSRPGGPWIALRDGDLQLLPSDAVWANGWLRTLHCPATDPGAFTVTEP